MASVANRTAVVEACPACSTKACKVAPLTVHALVKPELADTVREEAYRFCESSACDVVYFSEAQPEHRFLRADVRVRVGQKETELPIQVCYCFDWTTDDIESELRLTGTTTIPDRIRLKVQQGFCHCETMNPQGTCCLGNVNRAVKEMRAKLASLPGAGTDQPQHNWPRAGAAPALSASARAAQSKEKGAFLATLGAFFTAILGSACCWLPLLLIAFGFSAAGVGSIFEQYRAYFLTATFALLAIAWYITYRTAIRGAWARLRGKLPSVPIADACCAADPTSAATDSYRATEPEPKPAPVHSCCGIESQPAAEVCCATQAKAVAGQPVRRRFTVREVNRVMLWVATVLIVLFALFPHWIGLFLGSGSNPIAAVNRDDQQQIVLDLKGITCEACAPTVERALLGVPGVAAATVSYEKKQAIVLVAKGQEVPHDALLQAVLQAGYSATISK